MTKVLVFRTAYMVFFIVILFKVSLRNGIKPFLNKQKYINGQTSLIIACCMSTLLLQNVV